jgi:hypothetical protein
MTLPPDIHCRECQLSIDPRMRGAYNLFECRDCRVRYALDFIDRIAGKDAESTKDALFEKLAKGRP